MKRVERDEVRDRPVAALDGGMDSILVVEVRKRHSEEGNRNNVSTVCLLKARHLQLMSRHSILFHCVDAQLDSVKANNLVDVYRGKASLNYLTNIRLPRTTVRSPGKCLNKDPAHIVYGRGQ